MNFNKKYKLGLALSGGGVRAFAHLGALKALLEEGLEPDLISGVSAGAIAGAFYADGFEPDEILEIFKNRKFFDFTQVKIPKDGLLSFSGLKTNILSKLRTKYIEDLSKKLIIGATCLNDADIEYFEKGDLQQVIIASASIPALFSPIVINGKKYVDGGIVNNLPVAPIKGLCRNTIAINTNYLAPKKDFNTIPDIMERVLHTGVNQNVKVNKEMADHYIEFKELNQWSIFDTSKSMLMFEIGYKKTKEYIKENKI